jgi:hypothetical protein
MTDMGSNINVTLSRNGRKEDDCWKGIPQFFVKPVKGPHRFGWWMTHHSLSFGV